MRMHIGLKSCHFLPLNLIIAEVRKNKNIGKTWVHCSSLCWDSTLEQLSFHRVSKINAKNDISWNLSLMSELSF